MIKPILNWYKRIFNNVNQPIIDWNKVLDDLLRDEDKITKEEYLSWDNKEIY